MWRLVKVEVWSGPTDWNESQEMSLWVLRNINMYASVDPYLSVWSHGGIINVNTYMKTRRLNSIIWIEIRHMKQQGTQHVRHWSLEDISHAGRGSAAPSCIVSVDSWHNSGINTLFQHEDSRFRKKLYTKVPFVVYLTANVPSRYHWDRKNKVHLLNTTISRYCLYIHLTHTHTRTAPTHCTRCQLYTFSSWIVRVSGVVLTNIIISLMWPELVVSI